MVLDQRMDSYSSRQIQAYHNTYQNPPCHNIKRQLAVRTSSNNCEKVAILSKTKNMLNDNNVTEVTFLGGRVADIFSLSFGPLGEPVSALSLQPSWLRSTITGKLFGL